MFHWKIIILIIVLKILSFIFSQYYTDNHVNKILKQKGHIVTEIEQEEEGNAKICITPVIKDFLLYWIKYAIEMVNYSRTILSKKSQHNEIYYDLEKTKDGLVDLFSKIHKEYSEEFKKLINEQIFLKINLCNAILYNDTSNVNIYSEELVKNTNNLSDLFNQLKKNKENDNKLKDTMNTQTSKYIESMHLINKAGNDEITRELVLGSLDTAKLLF